MANASDYAVNRANGTAFTGSTPSGTTNATTFTGSTPPEATGVATQIQPGQPGFKSADAPAGPVGAAPAADTPQVNTNQPSPSTVNATPYTGGDTLGYEDAQQNLTNGGLTGSALTSAQQVLAGKYGQALPALQAKGPAPQNAGDARSQIADTVQTPQDTSAADVVLQDNKAHQQILTDYAQYQSSQNQQESLTQTYTDLSNQLGIPALNTDLMNMKNVIDGTEDDIRNEVQKAGGFATNSQVLALTDSRNKVMIQNYNNLLETRNNAQTNLTTMIGLATQDRQIASQQIDRQLNFDQQQATYADKMLTNAQSSLSTSASNYGWNSIYQSALASGDPTAVAKINSTMGNGFDLATMAAQPNLDLELKQAQLTKIYSDMSATSGGSLANANLRTTTSGINYIDGTNLTGKDASAAQTAAAKAGVPYLDKTSADLQNNVETARQNMTNISSSLDGLLAKSGFDVGTKIGNIVSANTQTGANADALSSFSAYRSAAIQALRAMAGAKGLRINQAEIMQSVNQDIPKITDTVGVAKAKIAIVNSLLDSQEKGTFGSQYYSPTSSGTAPQSLLTPTQIPSGYYQASDGLLYQK